MQPLPIDALLPEVAASLRRAPNLVIEAPPGAGKTTRVPPVLLSLDARDVLVLEPRRVAARAAASRVAAERGERLGETVGYQVRFEEVAGPLTRLRFLTEGVLIRRLLADSRLRGVGAVVLDEFHERRLDTELALALLRRLQRTRRRDLRLVVMSATLDAAPLASFLGDCPVLRSEGRLYEVAVTYTPASPLPMEEQVAAALSGLVSGGPGGGALVFLPGAREIRRAERACAAVAARAGMLVLPLHGDLSLDEQARALLPAGRPKLVLATNVAESSVTVEGIATVIDTGLARIASSSPWTGLPVLDVSRISRASAIQRAGRAGRTGPGRVVRLYSAEDFARRPEREVPEIRRLELSQATLALHGLGIRRWEELELLDAPPQTAVKAAEELLVLLGAAGAGETLTEIGRQMLRYPLHPRLARLAIEAGRRGAGDEGCAIAALLSAGGRLPETSRGALSGVGEAGPSDVLALLDSEWTFEARRLYQSLRRLGQSSRARGGENDRALMLSILTAFPDRVARRRQGNELLLASGGAAVLEDRSVVRNAEFLVAVDAEDRSDQARPLVRLASAIEPGWLLDLYPERVRERNSVEWNRAAGRVEGASALVFDQIVLEETRSGAPDAGQAETLLAEKALDAGLHRFVDSEELERFLARVQFAAQHSTLPALTEEDAREALRSLCRGRRSFAELEQACRDGGLLRALEQSMPRGAAGTLEEVAPARIRLPGGCHARVTYSAHQPPWIASRLQDFFGMRESPRIARGKVQLVVHLLAPNRRPVQTTTDLEGFWQRLYPQVRRELSRRYPKHAWPENPGV